MKSPASRPVAWLTVTLDCGHEFTTAIQDGLSVPRIPRRLPCDQPHDENGMAPRPAPAAVVAAPTPPKDLTTELRIATDEIDRLKGLLSRTEPLLIAVRQLFESRSAGQYGFCGEGMSREDVIDGPLEKAARAVGLVGPKEE